MTNELIPVPADAMLQPPVRGTVVKSRWARNLLTFLAVFGPGLIVMVADNDPAGAVSTYTQAGAQYWDFSPLAGTPAPAGDVFHPGKWWSASVSLPVKATPP